MEILSYSFMIIVFTLFVVFLVGVLFSVASLLGYLYVISNIYGIKKLLTKRKKNVIINYNQIKEVILWVF